jgi:hypothetical protein
METGKEEAVSQDNLMNIKKFVNNPDKNGRFVNTKWKHANGDLVPMICFIQKAVYGNEEKVVKDNNFNNTLQTFLRMHGSGDFRSGYNIYVEDQLWQWNNNYSFLLTDSETTEFEKMNSKFYSEYKNSTREHMFFVAFCALRRVVGLLRQLPPNRRMTTLKNINVLEGATKVWERSLSLVTPYAISHLKEGMNGWVHRKENGTVMLVNDGTYDVRRDTAKTLRCTPPFIPSFKWEIAYGVTIDKLRSHTFVAPSNTFIFFNVVILLLGGNCLRSPTTLRNAQNATKNMCSRVEFLYSL